MFQESNKATFIVKIAKIIAWIDAQIIEHGTVDTINFLSTNSRTIISGSETLFFAITTQRNDGHNYLEQAYSKGVRNFVVSKKVDTTSFSNANFLLVNDSLQALQKLGKSVREQFTGKVIGITGSNGKNHYQRMVKQLAYC